MATAVKRKTGYMTYGNVAYDPAYDAIDVTAGRVEPLVRPRERVAGRAKVRVRPAGYAAPTAVLGFVLVGVLAVMLVWSYVQLTVCSDHVVHLRKESAQLTQEHSQLLSDYELAFDLKTVEETVTASGAMVQPQPGQLVNLDMAEPDSAQVYDPDKGVDTAKGIWDSFAGAMENIAEFFR